MHSDVKIRFYVLCTTRKEKDENVIGQPSTFKFAFLSSCKNVPISSYINGRGEHFLANILIQDILLNVGGPRYPPGYTV